MKGLDGAADGSPDDGKVTIKEVSGYLDDQVPVLMEEHRGSPQYPDTFIYGQDFPIGVVR